MRYLLLMIAAGLLASCTSREIRRGINYWEYADWPRDAAEFNEALYAYTKDWFPAYELPVFELKLYRDPEDVPRYNDAARALMQERGIAIDDLYAFALPRLEEIQEPVNVHFTAEGSKALGEEVARVIRGAARR